MLIIGPPGLGDLGLALYLNGASASLSGVSIDETAAGVVSHYDVSGLPDGNRGQRYELTWSAGGQAGVHRWPAQPGSPSSVILPLRSPGLVIGDIGAALYLDGAAVSTASLTLTSVGDDYRLGGLPAAPGGSEYRLAYRFGGIHNVVSWPDPLYRSGDLTGIPPRTIARRLLASYLVDAWQGQDLADDTLCPLLPAGSFFNPDNADHTFPWTVEEIQRERGFIGINYPDEIGSNDDRTTSGVETIDGEPRMVRTIRTLWTQTFATRVPAELVSGSPLASDPTTLAELYQDRLQALLDGVSLSHEGGPFRVSLRTLSSYPARRRGPFNDGPWLLAFLDVRIELRERRISAQAQEVTLS